MKAPRLLLYNTLGAVALTVAGLPALLSPRWRAGLGERLGLNDGLPEWEGRSGECIWVHGASVGEILAAAGLVRSLLERHPAASFVISAYTVAGRDAAAARFGGEERVFFTLLPLDWNGLPARVISRVRPSLFILLETELWPNLLLALEKRGCPSVLVNGRLSGRSFPRYRSLQWFFRPFLEGFRVVCARTEGDRERFRELGVPGEKIKVTGNIKYDGSTPADPPAKVLSWREMLQRGGGRRLLVAGSLRGRESALLLDAYLALKVRHPGLSLLMAPRHLERFDPSLLDGSGLRWGRWSESPPGGPDGSVDVVLLDTMGELSHLYGLADLAFVGGTLVGGEGHNLLEPASWSVPVLFGPGFRNFEEEGRALIAGGGGFVVEDGEALTALADRLLTDGGERETAGKRARETVSRFGGALEKTLAAIEEIFPAEAR